MIPVDPVDITNPAPFDPVSYYAHIAIGLVGLGAALVALISRKGSIPHIWAGRIFIASILVVSITALVLLATRFAPPLFVAALTAVYAVGTAYLALKPCTPGVRRAEYGFFAFEIVVLAVFLVFMAIPNVSAGNIPAIGPLVISIIPLVLLIGDINFFTKAKRRAELRLRRHLSRMIWAFVIAVRAPMAEIYPMLGLPVPLILFGPLVVAPLFIWLFWRKAGLLAVQVPPYRVAA